MTQPAHAQTLSMHTLADGIQGAAYVDTAYLHTDNFFFQSVNGVPGSGYFIKPYFQVNLDGPATAVQLVATGSYSSYSLPPVPTGCTLPGTTTTPGCVDVEKTYFDGLAAARLNWTAGTRSRVNLNGQYQHGHDAIGTARTQVVIQSGNPPPAIADKWNDYLVNGSYRFGAEDAAINIAVGGADRKRDYINNREVTRFLNFRADNLTAVLFFNYSPKTAFLLDLQHNWTRFDEIDTVVKHDGSETLYRAGLQWKATAKTTGDLRFGYGVRNIDSIPGDRSYFSYEGSVVWNPGARTAFSIGGGSGRQESYLHSVAYMENREMAADWAQQWGQRCSTWVTARLVKSHFVSPPGVGGDRDDDIRKIGFKIEYRLVKYVGAIASVDRTVRGSSFSGADYENLTAYAGVRLTP